MILIITRNGEISVDKVIDWLLNFNLPFIVLTEDNFFDIELDLDNFQKTKINNILISNISVIWFWKYPRVYNDEVKNEIINNIGLSTFEYINNEYVSFKEYFFQKLYECQHIKWLTRPQNISENKLFQMEAARKHSLKTPKTYIVSNKKKLLKLKKELKNIIVKPTSNIIHQKIKGIDSHLMMKTMLIEDYQNIPETFSPSLIQERIIKKYEIRCFFILGEFYSVRIIENNENNEVDHRLGMIDNSLRYAVEEIPIDIKDKLKNLLSHYSLNCASIDLILDSNNQYIFLEINPTGQFSYHSLYTNTNIENKIASALKILYEEK